MAYRDTLYGQFDNLLKRNKQRLQNGLIAQIEMMLPKWTDIIIDQQAGYADVTGNTITGLFVGAYIPINERMELVGAAFSGDEFEPPTRPWLKKGESYNLPYYYGGVAVAGKPFVGKVGNRNEDSYDEAIRFLRNHKPKKSPLAFVVGNSTDYSSYLEMRNGANLITQFCDDRKNEGWIVEMHGKS